MWKKPEGGGMEGEKDKFGKKGEDEVLGDRDSGTELVRRSRRN